MSPRHISTDMLWNTAINTDTYRGSAEKYQATILEQYKLCVEMADRISARRALANAFFLTLNSVLITSAGTGRIALAHCPRGWLAIGLVVYFSYSVKHSKVQALRSGSAPKA